MPHEQAAIPIERVKRALAACGLIPTWSGCWPTPALPKLPRAVNAPLGSIVKSLVFLADGAPLLVLVSGDQRADVHRLRAALGLSKKRLRIAQPAEVLDLTGFEVGGVPPIGHDQGEPQPAGAPDRNMIRDSTPQSGQGIAAASARTVRTVIDRTLDRFDVVWAAAGSPNAVFPIAYGQLVAVTGGEVMDLVEQA